VGSDKEWTIEPRRCAHWPCPPAQTILTSNKPFADWEQIFTDTMLVSALLDRLLHRRCVINQAPRWVRLNADKWVRLIAPSPHLAVGRVARREVSQFGRQPPHMEPSAQAGCASGNGPNGPIL